MCFLGVTNSTFCSFNRADKPHHCDPAGCLSLTPCHSPLGGRDLGVEGGTFNNPVRIVATESRYVGQEMLEN